MNVTDISINKLAILICNALPIGYDVAITSGVSMDDTIKVTCDGSTLVMYLEFDRGDDTVLDATVWDEIDPPEDCEVVEEGIYWNMAEVTVNGIAADITKHI